MGAADTVVDVIGFSAGFLVATSLLPQIWRAHKRGSAEDLSFIWQGTLALGVSLQLVYLYHYGMWAVFVPLFSELVFILYLASLKAWFEHSLCGLGRGGYRRAPDDDRIGKIATVRGANGDGGDRGGREEDPDSNGGAGGEATGPYAPVHGALDAAEKGNEGFGQPR